MDYDSAVALISNTYGVQLDSILKSLSTEAIITLGKLHTQNIKRPMSSMTVMRLSAMPPYKQVDYLNNPMLAFLMDKCCNDICAQPSVSVPVSKTETKSTTQVKPVTPTQPTKKPEPEPSSDSEPEPDAFDIFG